MKTLVINIAINFAGFFNLCVQIVCITSSCKINANVEKNPKFGLEGLKILNGMKISTLIYISKL